MTLDARMSTAELEALVADKEAALRVGFDAAAQRLADQQAADRDAAGHLANARAVVDTLTAALPQPEAAVAADFTLADLKGMTPEAIVAAHQAGRLGGLGAPHTPITEAAPAVSTYDDNARRRRLITEES